MGKPIILLTPQHEENSDRVSIRTAYTDAVIKFGGIPLTVSLSENDEYIRSLLEIADGLLFTGGDDVAPELYGEIRSEKCKDVSLLRDGFEIKAARLASIMQMPVLGICRGIQVLNVAFGGDLYQDMPGHMQSLPKSSPSHTVRISTSPLSDVYSGTAKVNSFHHQAVKNPGQGLEVCGISEDGYIEAIFLNGVDFFVGVQWHPEHMLDTDACAKALFEKFVRKSAIYKSRNTV